ncbi:MAG: glycosyltransferase family 2 protein, partial [Microbacterium sp.]
MVAADSSTSGPGTQAALRRGLARTARRLRHGRPTLSIIVLAAGGDPGRLHATLSSVRDQPSPAIELVVVTHDGGEPAARAAAGDDTRARFFRADSAATARTVGLQRSRGRFVLVATSGDVYPRGVLVELLDGLADDDALQLTPGPLAYGTPYLGRFLLARSRLAAAVTAAQDPDPDGLLVGLQVLRGDVRVAGFPAYRDARADAPGPFVVRRDPFPDLAARVARDRASLAALADVDLPRAARARAALTGLRPFLDVADAASPEDWALLVQHAAALRALLDPRVPGDDVVSQALALLAADGRRDDVVGLAGAVEDRDFPTVLRDGRVVADLPVAAGLLSDDDLEVSEAETPVVARVRRLLLDGPVVVLELLVAVRHLDQALTDTVRVELVGETVHPMVVRLSADPAVSRWAGETEHDHDAGLVRAELDVRDLPAALFGIGVLWSDGEFERSGVVSEIAAQGSAARQPVLLPDGRSIGLHERHGRVALGITEAKPVTDVVVHRVEVDGEQLRLTVDRAIDAVRLEGEGRVVDAVPGASGFWTVPLRAAAWGLGDAPLPTGSYRLVLV